MSKKEIGPCAICLISAMCSELCPKTGKFLKTIIFPINRLDDITLSVVSRWMGNYFKKYDPKSYERIIGPYGGG